MNWFRIDRFLFRKFNMTAVIVISLSILSGFSTHRNQYISQYNIRHWTTLDGFPSNSILTLIQSQDGFIWMGSYNGLIQFDGANARVHDKYSDKYLPSNSILSLYQDASGHFFFGTQNGLTVSTKEGWLVFQKEHGLPSNFIFSILRDSQQRLWVGTDRGLCYKVNNRFTNESLDSSLINVPVNDLMEDRLGQLWVATQGSGVVRIQSGGIQIFNQTAGLPSNNANALELDRDGSVWVGTDEGLCRIGSDMELTQYPDVPEKWIRCLRFDRQNQLWVGTDQGICIYYDKQFSSILKVGLPQYQPQDIIEDIEGNIWVATYRSGVFKLHLGKFSTISEIDGLSGQKVLSLFHTRENNILAATDNGLDIISNGKISVLKPADQLPIPSVKDVYQDSRDRLWICTRAGLIQISDGEETLITTEDGLSDNYVRTAMEDSNGNIWIGTQDGLNLLSGNEFQQFDVSHGLASPFIIALFEDSRGDIWISTRGGLTRYSNGSFQSYYMKDGLPGNVVFRIHEDEQGLLWIGTDGGVVQFDGSSFTSYTMADGLPVETAFQVLEDNNGNLWVSSDQGIYKMSRQKLLQLKDGNVSSLTPRLFTHHDGMRTSECTASSRAVKDDAGRIWFATFDGIALINPAKVTINTVPTPVLIQDIQVNDNPLPVGQAILMQSDQNRLQIRYTALSYVSPEQVRFKYMLEGHDADWIDAGTTREILYPSFPAGRYTFKVIACNNDGIWNLTGAELVIRKLEHFYKSPWFYFSMVGLGVLVFWVYFRLRVMKMKENQKLLEDQVSERTQEIQDQHKQLENYTQLLEDLAQTDPLTGLLNRRTFFDLLDREWRHCIRDERPITIVMIDIDYFKRYNDRYGHLKGDDCLQEVAGQIKKAVKRSTDLTARYGGEEFIVALPRCDISNGQSKAAEIREKVSQLRLEHADSPAADHVTISLGAACIVPKKGESYLPLINTADEALYQAKSDGRNRVAILDRDKTDTGPDENPNQ